ncbi:MAG: flagellar hook-associated protein FlgL [Candidatus Gastranaerophilales bacterium]|nr:flagellar hook-associated protein FlgL [Candidatus Gastranaerophilales bacterium]
MAYSRITNSYLSQSILSNTMMNQSKYVSLNYQYSTQKKVNNLSDDPISLTSLMNSKNDMSKIDAYLKSVGTSNAQLQMSESTLSLVNKDLDRINQLATQAANELNGADEASDIADEIEESLKNIITLANTKYNGSYLFSGANVNTPPYATDGANCTYQGTTDADNLQVKVQVSEGSSIVVNENGDSIFGQYYVDVSGNTVSQGAIGHVKELLADLRSDPPNYDNVRAKLDVLKKDMDNVTYYQTKAGTSMSMLEKTKTQLQSQNISADTLRSTIEDANLVEIASKMQYQQFALQASLQSSTNVLQQSLLNYMQ